MFRHLLFKLSRKYRAKLIIRRVMGHDTPSVRLTPVRASHRAWRVTA